MSCDDMTCETHEPMRARERAGRTVLAVPIARTLVRSIFSARARAWADGRPPASGSGAREAYYERRLSGAHARPSGARPRPQGAGRARWPPAPAEGFDREEPEQSQRRGGERVDRKATCTGVAYIVTRRVLHVHHSDGLQSCTIVGRQSGPPQDLRQGGGEGRLRRSVQLYTCMCSRSTRHTNTAGRGAAALLSLVGGADSTPDCQHIICAPSYRHPGAK